MRKPYLPVVIPRPLFALGGRLFHYRPVMAVRLSGPRMSLLSDGLLDSGADETAFHEDVALPLGIDLTGAEERKVELIGRPGPVRCRYASVQLHITDGVRETYEWTAIVGFASTRLRYSLLGQSGFLEFFDVDFRGAAHEVVLLPNAAFSGTQVAMPPRP